VRWYRRAAEQGLAGAESNMGIMYEDGLGVAKDYREAAQWYSAAAGHGDSRGQYNLATLYFSGRGVPLDYVSAYVWYSLAAAAGDSRSAAQLKEVSRLMPVRQRQAAESRVAERRAAMLSPAVADLSVGMVQRSN
jgi:uncharacterized protein